MMDFERNKRFEMLNEVLERLDGRPGDFQRAEEIEKTLFEAHRAYQRAHKQDTSLSDLYVAKVVSVRYDGDPGRVLRVGTAPEMGAWLRGIDATRAAEKKAKKEESSVPLFRIFYQGGDGCWYSGPDTDFQTMRKL